MISPSRALAAGIFSAAALVAPAAVAVAAEPNSGVTVVVTGDDHYVAADGVVVRHAPTEHSAVVEIARHGDVFTVPGTHVPDADADRYGPRRWPAVTNRRTGAHG
ncbi:hypothetical protein OG948_46165 (plasmid) [Embleya sp. NBC_00888]|uniref:hypothetical protein n=1 Tax=Embleya sp. NBC_00888 TaxID=2975960 RepID=UPI002F90C01A|nr:hypothetical protein OG948_46165 [Embleya sp. NBC_00888]